MPAFIPSFANMSYLYAQLTKAGAVIYCIAIFCGKYAVLHQIKAIFYQHRRQELAFKVIWALIWMNLFIYVVTVFIVLFWLQPYFGAKEVCSRTAMLAGGELHHERSSEYRFRFHNPGCPAGCDLEIASTTEVQTGGRFGVLFWCFVSGLVSRLS